jgi:anthranilate synthase/aminodeoxychorismate synthase-like glutamine amidotransferase
MRVLLVDNFDSFTYNLAQYLGDAGAEPVVVRSDATVATLEATAPDALVVSPGPGRPEDAGCSIAAIRHFAGRVPVLGVCLGHQAIGVAFGGHVVRAGKVMHGKTSEIFHRGDGVFDGLANPLVATRYHSLVIDRDSLPPELEVTAETSDGVIMGVRHRELAVEGVQFHPESALTAAGRQLIGNFLRQLAGTAGLRAR